MIKSKLKKLKLKEKVLSRSLSYTLYVDNNPVFHTASIDTLIEQYTFQRLYMNVSVFRIKIQKEYFVLSDFNFN